MDCLYCGKRLPLLRRLSDGEFCTPEHRAAYHEEQQRLAVKRLIDARWPDRKLAVARQMAGAVTIIERDWLSEPTAPELLRDEPLVFLDVAPQPRQSENFSLHFEDEILPTVAIVLPEPLGLARRAARADHPLPLTFSQHALNRQVQQRLNPLLEAESRNIQRPRFGFGLDLQDSEFHRLAAHRPSEPPFLTSLQALPRLILPLPGEPGTMVECNGQSEPFGSRTPIIPLLPGRTHGLAEIPGVLDTLPFAPALAWTAVKPLQSAPVFEMPGVLSGKPRITVPDLPAAAAEERLPRRVGRLRRPVPVARLALGANIDFMDDWRRAQAETLACPVGLVAGLPRLQAAQFQPVFHPVGEPLPWPSMPAFARCAAVEFARVSYQEEAPRHWKPRLRRSPGRLKTTFESGEVMQLRKRVEYGFPAVRNAAKPKPYAAEEFHAWLNVPIFAPLQKSRRKACGLPCGKTGVEAIGPKPLPALQSNASMVLPMFSLPSPLVKPSGLGTVKPPLLTRKRGFLPNPEDALRKQLIPKFQLRGLHFWREAPADLKWITLGLPIVVIIVFQATLQKRNSAIVKPEVAITQQMPEDADLPADAAVRQVAVRPAVAAKAVPKAAEAESPEPELAVPPQQSASTDTGFWGSAGKFFSQRLNNLKLNLAERAGVELSDDFRSGLAAWQGASDWARTWGYDRVGLLRPGQLALYQPSVKLTDYTLEFTATTEHGAVGWVFRARNLSNYYGMRLARVKTGAGNTAMLERWIVAGGREYGHRSIPLRFPVWEGNTSEVKMTIEGNSYTTYVNGQIADTWTDARNESGGIGFSNERGGDARIHRVTVAYQNDVVGRICAMLVPQNLILKQQGIEGRIIR